MVGVSNDEEITDAGNIGLLIIEFYCYCIEIQFMEIGTKRDTGYEVLYWRLLAMKCFKASLLIAATFACIGLPPEAEKVEYYKLTVKTPEGQGMV